VHPRAACVEAAMAGGLARSLRRAMTDAERVALAQITVIPSQKVAGLDRTKAVERSPRIQAKE
jgi:hypothetical protein